MHITPLTVVERKCTKAYLIRCIQKEFFGELYNYIKSLKEKKCDRVPKNLKIAFAPLKRLSVFCDSSGILRASSRIVNSLETYDVCYPILLPKRHPFVELIIMHYHREVLHMGWSQVLANMRKKIGLFAGNRLLDITYRHACSVN